MLFMGMVHVRYKIVVPSVDCFGWDLEDTSILWPVSLHPGIIIQIPQVEPDPHA